MVREQLSFTGRRWQVRRSDRVGAQKGRRGEERKGTYHAPLRPEAVEGKGRGGIALKQLNKAKQVWLHVRRRVSVCISKTAGARGQGGKQSVDEGLWTYTLDGKDHGAVSLKRSDAQNERGNDGNKEGNELHVGERPTNGCKLLLNSLSRSAPVGPLGKFKPPTSLKTSCHHNKTRTQKVTGISARYWYNCKKCFV